MKNLDKILAELIESYSKRVPHVQKIIEDMLKEKIISSKDEIENDHIAFRTIAVPHLGIASLEKIFLHYGYTKKDSFVFKKKKLKAYWYAPPENHYPRVFISELCVDQLSPKNQEILNFYTNKISSDPVEAIDLDDSEAVVEFFHKRPWATPTWQHYSQLLEENEFAAWVLYSACHLNHFTLTVHNHVEPYETIENFNFFLDKYGYKLNSAGGKIKISKDKKLLQSSTVAQTMEGVFADGDKHRIASSYVEFAERRVLDSFEHYSTKDIRREHRRDGFEADNADAIFESTYTSQLDK